jgi:O-antigen biosynthesis protein
MEKIKMGKKEFISIGILNYNGLRYLKKTISSILKLDYSNYEIVIVDNASTDDSIKYIKYLKNKKIRIIKNKKNYGYSKGKNICVENCRGKYVLLLDEDIKIIDKKLLKKFINFYKSKKDIAFLAPLFRDAESEKTKYYGFFSTWYGLNIHKERIPIKSFESKKEYKIGAYHGGAVFFNKNIWSQLGGYSLIQDFVLDDFDLGFRSYIFGFSNYLFPYETIIHLGKSKDLDKTHFAKKYRYYFSGVSIMMWRNYNLRNLIIRYPIFFIFSIILYLGLAIIKRNIRILISWPISFKNFILSFNRMLKERKKIQLRRKINEDIFLKIKPPRFN